MESIILHVISASFITLAPNKSRFMGVVGIMYLRDLQRIYKAS